MKVRYTDPASDDLQANVAYFREHAFSSLAGFAKSIDEAVAHLIDNPYLGQETERSGIRRWYIRRFNYSIFYTIDDEEM